MSESMPKAFLTEMRVSGTPGESSDPTRAFIEFMDPPRSPAGGKERHSLNRIPGARKKRPRRGPALSVLTPSSARGRDGLLIGRRRPSSRKPKPENQTSLLARRKL